MKIINNYKTIRDFTNKERISNFLVFFVYRPLGFLFAASIFNTQIKPNHITIFKYFFAFIALYLIFISKLNSSLFFIGFFLYFVSDILDYADGSLARAKNLTSKFGRILDTVSDHFFSSIFFFIICLKTENIIHLYFLIVFLSISWSQVYVNTLLKFYNNQKSKKKLSRKNLENKKKSLNIQLNLFKSLFRKLLLFLDFISINLNLITLFVFIVFDLLYGYLIFFFIYKSFLITLNLTLILKNNFNFLNTKDYE